VDRSIAVEIRELLEGYQSSKFALPRLKENLVPEPLTGFHQWADSKEFEGGFLIETTSGSNIWVLLINWNDENGNGFYVVLFPEDRAGPIAEIHEIVEDSSGRLLKWRYKPSKRDGQNEDRKAYFERYFLSLEVFISVPSTIEEVSDFLNELVSLAENRSKADVLDSNTPNYRDGFPEGKKKERLHKSRERNSSLIKEVKSEALMREGKLVCQCCGFDFESLYGELGKGFIEAHHTKPVSELSPDGEKTKKEDIALVCSNCHRMLHRRRPWLEMDELKNLTSAFS
jgi:hypothetical protein